ncbi:hypothetical protein ACS0TW_09665, partial [Klebsiella michiganensis]
EQTMPDLPAGTYTLLNPDYSQNRRAPMKNGAASPFAYTFNQTNACQSLDVSGIIRGCDFVSRIIMGKLCVKQK